MGQLVSVVATTHNPRIFWNRDKADPADLKRLENSFGELRESLASANPDVLIVVANDHLDHFFFDNLPAFAVATGASVGGPFWYEAELMRLPEYRATVHQELANDILRSGMDTGFELAQAAECRIDHAFTLPLSFLRPESDLPIVPVVTNVFGYPIPHNRRWFELGRFLRRVVAGRPEDERVAVLASFNLTVEVGGPRMGKYNRKFSKWVLELMAAGEVDTMLTSLTVPRLVAEGNSTAEFLNYVTMLGVMGDARPSYIRHDPIRGVGTCPLVMWEP